MTSASQVISIARSQLGIRESPAGSNIVKYSRWYGLTGPWCAMFVSWVFCEAGMPLPISTPKGFCYTPYGVNWAKRHGLWSESGRYAAGDVIFYNFDSDSGPEHTGIVVSDDGRTIVAIEGNTSSAGSQSNGGQVCVKHRPHGRLILGVLQASKLLAISGRAQPPTPPAKPPVKPPAKPALPVQYADHMESFMASLPILALTSPPMTDKVLAGSPIYNVQTLLIKHGLLNDAADGEFGPKTKAAVIGLQTAFHLTVDGVVGGKTYAILMGA